MRILIRGRHQAGLVPWLKPTNRPSRQTPPHRSPRGAYKATLPPSPTPHHHAPNPSSPTPPAIPDNGIRLLALDGGGVRGLSSLMILRSLMTAVDPDNFPKP
ncbi:hypothetical protein SODALDRAFT_156517 [Sodiomyces alkalinus F11]|uniref:PNPLA domain-containing protein n=1 Tax=Sodiomyces alkalinus (strain CBS 110278 / VKM F-3762 / F11) TaxID=1314773 RepID=A0A3N2PY74_SODAK|nr:hypothetical protein SODALDRAFT_156517 [Sodiomyces alkalinus F11]ROT39295.1 hypothetical protein SODALDRAFT_156517 [Sodiomyces alkalinus F11]